MKDQMNSVAKKLFCLLLTILLAAGSVFPQSIADMLSSDPVNDTHKSSTKKTAPPDEPVFDDAAESDEINMAQLVKSIFFEIPAGDKAESAAEGSFRIACRKTANFHSNLSMNTVMIPLALNDEFARNFAAIAVSEFQKNDIFAYIILDVPVENGINPFLTASQVTTVKQIVSAVHPDGIIFKGIKNEKNIDSTSEEELADETTKHTAALIQAVRTVDPAAAAGVFADKSSKEMETEYFFNSHAIIDEAKPNLIVADIPFSSETGKSFSSLVDSWSGALEGKNTKFIALLHNEKQQSGVEGWNSPSEIARQIIACSKKNEFGGFLLNSFESLMENKQGSSEQLIKFINNELGSENVLKDIEMLEPKKTNFSTNESSVRFWGKTDPAYAVLINGVPAARNDDGDFLYIYELKVGNNSINFSHKGKTITYQIKRMQQVIKSVSPSGSQELEGGMVITISAEAYRNSTVTAKIGGTTLKLLPQSSMTDEAHTDYQTFMTSFKLPPSGTETQYLGTVVFSASFNGLSETKSGGAIIVKPLPAISPDLPLLGGTASVIEVVSGHARAFDGSTTFDMPLPNQHTLPHPTRDYLVGGEFAAWNGSTYDTFVLGASGIKYRIRSYSSATGQTTEYNEVRILPAEEIKANRINSASVSVNGQRTNISFENSWSAPFNTSVNNTNYVFSSFKDYQVTSFSPDTVTLTFHYTIEAADFTLPENPLFSSYRFELDTSGQLPRMKLHLSLKKSGRFLGMWSYYDNGRLVLSFTNPPAFQGGGSLSGAVVALEPGHVGADPGAVAVLGKQTIYERDVNYALMNTVKAKLEALGARVVIIENPLGSGASDIYRRAEAAYNAGAHVYLSMHHNSGASSVYGIEAYYWSQWSYPLARHVFDRLAAYKDPPNASKPNYARNSGNPIFFYKSSTIHSGLPSILLETGFVSNPSELQFIVSAAGREGYANAITNGVVDYFKQIG